MASLTQIKNVAIIGATGRLGGYFLSALLAKGQHTITAITRASNKTTLSSGVKRIDVDYDSPDTLVAAFKGQDILVITLSVFAPPDTHSKLVSAAIKAGVPYIMPNAYGFDPNDRGLQEDDPYAKSVVEKIEQIRVEGAGVTKPVIMSCGFWYEWSLALGDPFFSVDIKNRKVVFFDEGTRKANVSTWIGCGRALVALLSLPVEKLEAYTEKPAFVASFLVSQKDMLDSVQRVTGTKDEDWSIEHEDSRKRFQEGVELMKKGDHMGFAKAMYTRIFFDDGVGNYEAKYGLDNAKLGLEKEDLDVATKRAVKMVESGWNPYAETQWVDRDESNHVFAEHVEKE